jgi:hypothetical protein
MKYLERPAGMAGAQFEKIFPTDVLTKRERVERTLNFQPVDRAALHEQLSYNPDVIALFTGKPVSGFSYTAADVGQVIRQTLDACFIPVSPLGKGSRVDSNGFTYVDDEWNSSLVTRPFESIEGARKYLQQETRRLQDQAFEPEKERAAYCSYMQGIQALIGETVFIDFSIGTGFCDCWYKLGLELFSYLYAEEPGLVREYMEAISNRGVRKAQAVGDPTLSPVVLIAEDFASKNGSIFSPRLLDELHFPFVRDLARAWHSRGIKVLYHSDGNWKKQVPALANCEVDGFYCLEPAVGMNIVELRRDWPGLVWAGGIDGIDLMERGKPEDVRQEVLRVIRETNVLEHGGIFIDTSSEISPTIPAGNYQAMVNAVNELRNPKITY